MDAGWVRGSRAKAQQKDVFQLLTWSVALSLPLLTLPLNLPQGQTQWMLLSLMALLAELASVQGSKGLIRFAIPILAIVWWQCGALAAWATDFAIILAAWVGLSGSHRRGEVRAVATTVLRASVSSIGAIFLASAATSRFGVEEIGSVVAPAAFVAGYLVVNRLFSMLKRSQVSAPSYPGHLPALLILCLSVAGVVLMREGAEAWTPLLLGPILAIRSFVVSRHRMEEGNRQTVETLAAMLQRAHPYTHRHLERVASISEEVALRLGLPIGRAKLIHQAALLHDIGKVAIDEDILDLPRKLTDDEFEHVKLHSRYGADILGEIDAMRDVSAWIRHHHERPDGRGYPEGLLDPEIPIESKIIAAVDAFDAMTGGMEGRDGRPFREPMSVDEALAELDRCSGTQFDPEVVVAFRAVVGGAA